MSLAPKIDEIAHAITTMDAELALFSETWLSSAVPDEPININGYQILRRDRVGWQHGGVCLYVKSSINCSVLADYYHPDHEVLWADLRPRRLPRGFSNIIMGVIYQYPDADDAAMKDYLISSLVSLEATYPNCAFILAGDFNRTFLPMIQSALKSFNLKPTVKFPTRGDKTLDQIFTNLDDYFSVPTRLPPFGLSDHVTIYMGCLGRAVPRSQSTRSLNRETSALAKSIVLGDFWWKFPGRICCPLNRHVKENCRCWPKLSTTVWTQLCLCAPSKSTRRIVLGCQRSSSSSSPVAKRPLLLEISPSSRSLEIKLTASASAVVRCTTRTRLRTCKIPNHATGGERLSSFAGLPKQQDVTWLLFFTPTSCAMSLPLQTKSTRHSSASWKITRP